VLAVAALLVDLTVRAYHAVIEFKFSVATLYSQWSGCISHGNRYGISENQFHKFLFGLVISVLAFFKALS
jgi:hypothetical protein